MDRKTIDLLLALTVLIALSVAASLLIHRDRLSQFGDQLRQRVEARLEQIRPQARPSEAVREAPVLAQSPVIAQSVAPGEPLTPATSWITPDDYPAEAVRNRWEGRVQIGWTVDERGRVDDCRTLSSSGHAVLDEATCRLVAQRVRYQPARDADGKPVPFEDQLAIVWTIP